MIKNSRKPRKTGMPGFAAARLALAVFSIFSSCGVDNMETREADLPGPALAAGIRKISGLKIFFGHQSVGANLLTGIGEICGELGVASPEIRRTGNGAEAARASEAGIFHEYVGKNLDPLSKIAGFEGIMRSGMGDAVDAAFLKFCYVDVNSGTDVYSLFAAYRKSMEGLKAEYPNVSFIHFTVPLETDEGGLKGLAKRLLGRRRRGFGDNEARQRYNELIRGAYLGKEPLFDIALIESTSPTGERASKTAKGGKYYALRGEYSEDGGHLNAAGRRRLAGHLIVSLAALVPPGK